MAADDVHGDSGDYEAELERMRSRNAVEVFPVVDGLPLRLAVTPDAVRDHFEAGEEPQAALVAAMSDEQLCLVGEVVLCDDRLYRAFHECLMSAVDEVAARRAGE